MVDHIEMEQRRFGVSDVASESLEGLVTALVIIFVRGFRQFIICKWMQSIYRHKIHQTYFQKFEVYASDIRPQQHYFEL